MNETRPIGNDTNDVVSPEVSEQRIKAEKAPFSVETQNKLQDLNQQVEAIPPEAQKLHDFLAAKVFSRYQIPESDKIKLIQDWHKLEITEQMFDPEYDIISEGVEYFDAELQKSYEVKEDKDESLNNEDFLAQLKTLQAENNWSNAELINQALDSGQIPESQIAKFETFQQLLSADTITNEADRAIVAERVNGLDIASMPDPVRFVQAEIYGDETLSEETKEEIQKKMGIPRLLHADTVEKTLNALNREDYLRIDGTTGALTEKNPGVINAYTQVYNDKEPGKAIFDFKMLDGRMLKFRFDKSSLEGDIYRGVYTIEMMAAFEKLSMAEPFFQRGATLTHGGIIDLHYNDMVVADRLGQGLLGETSGHNGLFLTGGRFNQIVSSLQSFRKEGDWATGDHDPDRTVQDLQELTIADDNGQINWTQFARAADFIQQEKSKGAVPTFDILKQHLVIRERH